MLPSSNRPAQKHLNSQVIKERAELNFGTFEVLAGEGNIEHFMEVKQVQDKAHNGEDIGKGVFTMVAMMWFYYYRTFSFLFLNFLFHFSRLLTYC